MSHLTSREGNTHLIERLNRFPLGAPPSKTLYEILSLLFTPKEAELVSLLPIKPFKAETAAQNWKVSLLEAQKMLDTLCSKALVIDIEQEGSSTYVLPPPMAGFFEFSLMRTGGHVDQKLISELFYQYLSVEEEFIKALFTGETKPGRTFVNENALSPQNSLHVLDYERASHIIESSKYMGVGMCYCRHKKQHLGTACDAPMDICMTFGNTAHSLSKHGYTRLVEKSEGLELLELAREHKLVQFGENAQNGVNFICNCCSCCCEALTAARRFAFLNPVETTNFLPEIDLTCNGCSKCAQACPVEAISMVSAHDPQKPKKMKALLDESRCLGCGVCVTACKDSVISLKERAKRIITPINSAHKTVMMAIERGKLQDLIFDNQALWNHRAMAAILGVLLKLPPIKQMMASEQIKSRYFGKLLADMK